MKHAPLKRLVDSRRPITYGIVQAGPDVAGGVPYVRPVDMLGHRGVRDLRNLRRTSPEIAATYARSSVQSGDVIVSIGPSFGKTMVVPPELDGANLTQGTARVAPSARIFPRFLVWALQSAHTISYWESAVGGATFRALNLEPLANTPIPEWSMDRQRAIADLLDVETARIDALIDKKAALSSSLDARWRRELLEQLHVTGGGGTKAPWVGGSLPVGWELRPLRRLITRSWGGDWGAEPGTGVADRQCVRAADFDFTNLRAIQGATRAFDPPTLSHRVLRTGDMVLEKSGGGEGVPVGRVVAWRGGDGAVPTNFAAGLHCATDADADFVLLAFRAAYELGLPWRSIKQSTGLQNLDLNHYLTHLWPVPPHRQQASLAAELMESLRQMRELQQRLAAQVSLLREHRQALITAAVTGEMGIPGVA